MDWKEFDKKVLTPFKKEGDEAGMFMSDANVFSYTQVRYIALKAFGVGRSFEQRKSGIK